MNRSMLKGTVGTAMVLLAVAGMLTDCGGSSSSTPPRAARGVLYTFVGDTPSCDVLGFHALVTQVELIRSDGAGANVFPFSMATFPNVELASLRDFNTILSLTSVAAGTYTQANVSLSVTAATVYDPTRNPPRNNLPVVLTTGMVTAAINPPVTITQGKISALQLDFDLARSLATDSQGQITGTVTPVISALGLTPSVSQGFGEMDDLSGFVRSVSTSSSNPAFQGGFLLQMLSGTGPALEVNLPDISTELNFLGYTPVSGAPLLSQLLTGSYVEMDGYVDSNGNLVANSAQIENQASVADNKFAYAGPVISVTRDTSGRLIQYIQIAREVEPSATFTIPTDFPLTVNVSSATKYSYPFPAMNFAKLPFGSANLAVGQLVVTHGASTQVSRGRTGTSEIDVAADSVFLRLQTLEGTFASLLQDGADDRTGAFQFTTCGTLFASTPVMVFTDSNTSFVNIAGLSQLAPSPSILVKGLLFFEPQATTINGVSVPAGTMVVMAKQVHQMN